MELHFLGTGGNSPIPMPTCTCRLCAEARERGQPYARHGNSIYLPELGGMIDAPEFAFENLNRAGVDELEYVLLTHWHPDHVNGLRVVQSRDFGAVDRAETGLLGAYAGDRPTLVTTRAVYERTLEVFGQLEFFVEEAGFADLHLLDEEPLEAAGFEVRSVPYALEGGEEDATAFVVERAGTTLVVALDDAKYLEESRLPEAIDAAVFECGLFEYGPGGERILTDRDLAFLADEPTHEEVLDRTERLDPDLTYLTEIGHINARSVDDYRELASAPAYDGVEFARDDLRVDV